MQSLLDVVGQRAYQPKTCFFKERKAFIVGDALTGIYFFSNAREVGG
jgi:hypothetical protein